MSDKILEKFDVDTESTSGFFHEVFNDVTADDNVITSLSYTIGFVPKHRFTARFREKTTQDYIEYGIKRAELRVHLDRASVDTAKSAEGGTLTLEVSQNFSESTTQVEKKLFENSANASGELTSTSAKLSVKAGQKKTDEESEQEVNSVTFQYCHITTTANFSNLNRPTWVFSPRLDVLEGMLSRRHLCHIYSDKENKISGHSSLHISHNDITIYSFPEPPTLKYRVSGLGTKWMKARLIDLILQNSKKTKPIQDRKL